jgi:hypothetical protein
MVAHVPVIPEIPGSFKKEGMVQDGLGKKGKTNYEINRAKQAGGVAQVVPSKRKALSSNPSTKKRKKVLSKHRLLYIFFA